MTNYLYIALDVRPMCTGILNVTPVRAVEAKEGTQSPVLPTTLTGFYIMGPQRIDLTGNRYGRLVVLGYSHQNKNTLSLYYWNCQCDCGNKKLVSSICLKNGTTKSCGCILREFNNTKIVHGLCIGGSFPLEMNSWAQMKQRCYNEKCLAFKNYGGRGIKVCERWLNSFSNFIEDMGVKPTLNHSLDRFPDINGDYEPGNCRWATRQEQSVGKRKTVWIEYNGKKYYQSSFCKLFGVARTSLVNRLRNGWTLEQIVEHYKHPFSKHTENEIYAIRKMRMGGVKIEDIVKLTGLSIGSVKHILSYRSYKNIKPKL